MFCENCGVSLEGNTLFCPNCGHRITTTGQNPKNDAPLQDETVSTVKPNENADTAKPVSTLQTAVPSGQPAAPIASSYATGSRSPLQSSGSAVIDAVRRLAASPLYLIAAIAATLAPVLSVIGAVSAVSKLGGDLNAIFNNYSYDYSFDPEIAGIVQNAATTTSIVVLAISMIPVILLISAIWTNYISAGNREKPMTTAGLSIIKGVLIAALVGIGLVVLLCLFVMIMTIGLSGALTQSMEYSFSEYSGEINEANWLVVPVVIAMMAISCGILALVIVYYAKLIQTVNTVTFTIRTGTPSDRVSSFAAVMLFISAFFSTISMISGFFTSVFLGLAELCSAVALVCFGMLIFKYRDQMRSLGGAGVKPNQVYAAAPAGGSVPAQAAYQQYQQNRQP